MECLADLPDLSRLPLHEITQQFGTLGLEARFNLEIGRFKPEDQALLCQARDLAIDLHADDMRGTEPYVNHVLRVATRIMSPDHYDVLDADIVAAGLLHDSVEDHPLELARRVRDSAGWDKQIAALTALRDEFNFEIAFMVLAVTNPEYEKTADTNEQYQAHVRSMLLANPDAGIVKLSDIADNGVGINYSEVFLQARRAKKYRPLLPFYRDLALQHEKLAPPVKQRILAQLDRAAMRFDSLLQ